MVKLSIHQYIQKKDIEDNCDSLYDINYIYVLDYDDNTICEIHISDEERQMEIEDIIEKRGCNINTSSWMTTKNKIDCIIEI